MDVSEKLVELQSIITCPNAICNFCEHFKNKSDCEKHKKEVIADNMIAHGVTVQEWISVKDRLPEENEIVVGWCKDNPFSSYTFEIVSWNGKGWVFVYAQRYVTNVTHWMPLPQPPKGE